MIGFVMTTNLSQLKIAQLRSKNKRTLDMWKFHNELLHLGKLDHLLF